MARCTKPTSGKLRFHIPADDRKSGRVQVAQNVVPIYPPGRPCNCRMRAPSSAFENWRMYKLAGVSIEEDGSALGVGAPP